MKRRDWDWSKFVGSAECLKWSRRDLENLEAVLALTPGRTAVVQAGGNVGIFPKALAAEFASVYTLEPDHELFAALVRNAPEPNIHKLQAAAGYQRAPVALACRRRDGSDKPVHAGLTHVAGPGVRPQLRIDDLALPVCDLIYLDVEGWEYEALRGAAQTIKRCRPVIACEVNRGITFCGRTQDELRELIRSHGYSHAATHHSDEVWIAHDEP